ncbi:MAG: ATP:cob(I)alamin adenosyltransferase [Candidatus Izemoplasmatales bacterium]|jgi:ATP:cob(I)alamin adenosyltransferase|nr:ATP:cob(I)alamin adenosyltransferase [Candidatus Izemoplasmatales bacterium]MDD4987378.1 ATP:cob(I)alamin adenosyltransferase [Candidatus Izemoplasmatales bacterium]MDY0372685.1 ATP:cob(I)alamin adenosyltransferase [Candidatus Izemoplasmatales bacterium]
MKIEKARQIATKTGDNGTSRNYSGDVLSKADQLFAALGAIDEANSLIGIATHYVAIPELRTIQIALGKLSSQIATNPEDPKMKSLNKVTISDVDCLENTMELLLKDHPLEPIFSLPGSDTTKGGAYLDVARATTRRAERELVSFIIDKKRDDLVTGLAYLNRLSDLLFVYTKVQSATQTKKTE